jgi:hypothetical protein
MINKISKDRAFELSKHSPSLGNRRRYPLTRGCQAIPVTRRCLRLVQKLKQSLRTLEFEQRRCTDCQEFMDDGDPSQACCEIENQMAHLDTALCELQEIWEVCNWVPGQFADLDEIIDDAIDEFLNEGD